MSQKKPNLSDILNKDVVLYSNNYPEGKIIQLKKDRAGLYWEDAWHRNSLNLEEDVKIYTLSATNIIFCEHCGGIAFVNREGKRFCSDLCRVRANQQKNITGNGK
jgi:hypothetical protein